MALFAIWADESGAAAAHHSALYQAAQVVPALTVATRVGPWQVAAFACASRFYAPADQLWIDPAGGACVLHGLIWRIGDGALLNARDVAALLPAPGAILPGDVAGEYAIARIYPDGRLDGFSDPAGLHQLFRDADGAPVLSNRAAFVALLAGGRAAARDSALWLTAIGYRCGIASGWEGVSQLAQGEHFQADLHTSKVARGHLPLPAVRGFAAGGAALIEQGLAQAQAAVRLAAGGGPIDLPITGGKDSRVVLAIALAAGLRDRLTLFTRGYAGHPDVVVGELIAARLGLPHRREAPLGSDLPADLSPHAFMALLRTIAFQTDGGMGGWDNVAGSTPGAATLISGHLGEVLKAYAKRLPDTPLDPVAMVRLQAPFDPMELIRPDARAQLVDTLAAQMDAAKLAGAAPADLPDLFYWRNRVPNWLGGIRGVKSFERQPVLPLGVPALMRLAFLMTAEERRSELAHYRLIEAAAPELLDLPFAHQSWHPDLGAAEVAPVLAAPGVALFGSWQWSVNRVPGVRAALTDLFASADIPLWQDVDRGRLLELLRHRRFDYPDLISLLGLAVAAIHQSGCALSVKLGGKPLPAQPDQPGPETVGHVDLVRAEGGTMLVDGWVWAPGWPGASVTVEARVGDRTVAIAAADRLRPDLAAAGIGDGRHAFTLRFDADLIAGADRLVVAAVGRAEPLTGGDHRPDGTLPGGG